MTRNDWITICLAFICGLLLANSLLFSSFGTESAIISIGLAVFIGLITSRSGLQKVTFKSWSIAAMVAILAAVYFQLRIPQPAQNDISYLAKNAGRQLVTVSGEVLTEPRLTASQKTKFWFKAKRTTIPASNQDRVVSGKLYVTLPLLQATGIYPGKNLKVRGYLYLPDTSNNPGSFDFKTYLAREGAFAGLQSFEVVRDRFDDKPVWGWGQLRHRIVRSQIRGLGSPWGQLISSMVLGRKAVDLPAEIRDRFVGGGLAHILAASGFHVSLLLGIVLKATKRLSPKSQLIIGLTILFGYVGLTGLQPSVFRASLMGAAVLFATALKTKVKPLGSLLLAATIILLVNPWWVGDVGFQLSFLATFGLIVTLPALQSRLDWLPPTVTTLIAVPVAASIWVLPLLSYVFNTVATYSVVVNIVTMPLVTIISLGGMTSAIASLIVPAIGSAIAWLLLYPTLLLNGILEFFTNLPGSTWAIGRISPVVFILIYCLFGLVWLHRWWRKRSLLAFLLAIALIVLPIGYSRLNFVGVSVLAAKQEQILVVRNRGKVILINSGSETIAKYNLLPFLTHQGINHIDYGIALDRRSNFNTAWSLISDRLPIKHFINSSNQDFTIKKKTISVESVKDPIFINSLEIAVDSALSVLRLTIQGQTWLILGSGNRQESKIKEYVARHDLATKPIILCWSDSSLQPQWLEMLAPKIAIASSKRVDVDTVRQLEPQMVWLHSTSSDGVLDWIPQRGFVNASDTVALEKIN